MTPRAQLCVTQGWHMKAFGIIRGPCWGREAPIPSIPETIKLIASLLPQGTECRPPIPRSAKILSELTAPWVILWPPQQNAETKPEEARLLAQKNLSLARNIMSPPMMALQSIPVLMPPNRALCKSLATNGISQLWHQANDQDGRLKCKI